MGALFGKPKMPKPTPMKMPEPPPPPKPVRMPTLADTAEQRTSLLEKIRSRRGRRSTILTDNETSSSTLG